MTSRESIRTAARSIVGTRLIVGGLLLCAIGVFGRWSVLDGIALNGLQGSNNGWLVLLYLLLAAFTARAAGRGSMLAISALIVTAALTFITVVAPGGPSGASAGWGRWLTGLGSFVLAGAALELLIRLDPLGMRSKTDDVSARAEIDVESNDDGIHSNGDDDVDSSDDDETTPRRWVARLGIVGLVLAVLAYAPLRQVIAVSEQPSWPPPADAITSAGAQQATQEFAASNTRPSDVGLDYAVSTAATIEPHVEGVEFFPRIFADVEAAESSVHILMFGWKAGAVGTEMAALLDSKLSEGVEVRILVDGFGSAPFAGSESMFQGLVDAGAEIVVNDILPIDKDGLWQDRSLDLRHDELGRADHRKLYVVDGEVMWTGGAGLEDHFRNGRFHDVMVRVTGDVVRQAQAVFLTSFSSHDAPLPSDLSSYFPAQEEAGTIPIAVLQVVPGGFVSATQSVRELIDTANARLDIMNPYFTDKDMIERIINAAERGVDVRIVVSEKSNNAMATAAFRHHVGDLLDAGVEIWEYPAVVHAKLIVSDDHVHFGTLNLDAWALYRDFEFALTAEDTETADRFVSGIFDVDIGESKAGQGASGFGIGISWFADKIAYFL